MTPIGLPDDIRNSTFSVVYSLQVSVQANIFWLLRANEAIRPEVSDLCVDDGKKRRSLDTLEASEEVVPHFESV